MVKHNHDVGHADGAAYALQARSLALEGSLKIPYVSTFFRKEPPEIWRYDDHWPPMLSFLMAPAYRIWGVDAAHGRAVCVGIGAFLLPLMAAWLGLAASHRAWVGLAMAAVVLVDPLLCRESLGPLSDVLRTALLAGFVAAMLTARVRQFWFLGAGVLLAVGYYSMGSQLFLLGCMPVLALVVCGPAAFRSRWLLAGIGVAVLLMLPRWVAMGRHYGNPLHSTQNYASAFYGVTQGWDSNFYKVYWDRNLPRLSDRFRDWQAWRDQARRNWELYLRDGLLGSKSRFEDWPALGESGKRVQAWFGDIRKSDESCSDGKKKLSMPWITVLNLSGMVWGLAVMLIWPGWLARLVVRWRLQRPSWRMSTNSLKTALDGGLVLALITLLEAGFMIACWAVVTPLWGDQHRYPMILMPLLAALGCLGLQVALEGPGLLLRRVLPRRWRRGLDRVRLLGRRWGWAVTLCLCLAMAVVAWRYRVQISVWQGVRMSVQANEQDRYNKYRTVALALQQAGIGENAVIMCRNPWELLFYMPPKTRGVALPYATPNVLFAVAKYYGVTHYLRDGGRPGLSRFLRGDHLSLKPIGVMGGFEAFSFDPAYFKEGDLADLDKLGEGK